MSNSDWYSELVPSNENDDDNHNNNNSQDNIIPTTITNISCNIQFPPWNEDYTLYSVTCIIFSIFGLWNLLFGYRCFKLVMFYTGFVFGTVIVYCICIEENILPMYVNALIAGGAGFLFGLITLLVQYVGLFMLGFHSGLLSAIVGICIGSNWIQLESPWHTVGIMILTGLVMALLNLAFQKTFTIWGSALYGSAIITAGLDYFIDNSKMLEWVWNKVRVIESEEPCWISWLILLLWPVSMFIGMVTQISITGKEIYHEKQFPTPAEIRQRKESKEERKQRKYQYLYQIRTSHGDVISQPIPNRSNDNIHEVSEIYSA